MAPTVVCSAGAGHITSKFHQWNIYATGAGQGVYHDVPEPCGDNYFTDFTLAGNQTTGFEIGVFGHHADF